MSKRSWFWLVFGAGLLIRMYGIGNPLLDNHAWRQVDTASMAANFLEYGFLPPVPQLNYDGPPPNYAELEFPMVPLLVAAAWSLFGKSDLLARVVVLLFSGGTLVLIYLCGKQLYDATSGILAMAFFSVNPLAIYYGRTVMPDSAMLFFMCVSLFFCLRWYASHTWRDLVLSAAGFALAVLAKLPGLLIAVPILILALQRFRQRLFITREFWLFAVIGLLPPLAYYWSAHIIAANQLVSSIVQSQISLQLPGYDYLSKKLARLVTQPLIIVAGFGIFARRAFAGNAMFWGWALVMLIYTVTVGARIQLEYYLLPLLPLLCL
ncbi:MAG TPA: glycosyltransferase family 39 protein, partial [Verrucomicrobiae bacterium]|nr:glycosyltransferase family 39 protein [Verrucomicrobiae bacterium]